MRLTSGDEGGASWGHADCVESTAITKNSQLRRSIGLLRCAGKKNRSSANSTDSRYDSAKLGGPRNPLCRFDAQRTKLTGAPARRARENVRARARRRRVRVEREVRCQMSLHLDAPSQPLTRQSRSSRRTSQLRALLPEAPT